MKNHTEKEQLQEIRLELKRSRAREAHLQKENRLILNGLSIISEAQTKEHIFNGLLTVIKEFIPFDNALVLSSSDTKTFSVLASTNPLFNEVTWQYNDLFYRACNNETIVLFKPSQTYQFSFDSTELQSYFTSVAISGIESHSGYAVIILMSSDFGVYSTSTKETMQRFMPLVERAIIDIDYKERLNSLVAIKTKELKLSKERFQDFAETVGDWFWETDLQFNFTYLSDSKINSVPILSRNLFTLINDDSLISIIKSARANKISFNEIEWCPDIFHNQIWFSLSGTPFFDELGNLLGYRGTVKDISVRKRRIRDIQQSKSEAEKANKAKSQFLAMMSHEIRTPLNAILGLVDIFHDSSLSKSQIEWLNQMEGSAQLLLTIISDVLDISRIEAGSFTLDEQPIDLLSTINTAVDFFKDKVDKDLITLTVTVSHNVPVYVYADPTRIAQIIFNLVGNAVKFTKKGLICININQIDHGLTSISVSDTGIGIGQNALDQLFQPFVQADSSITRKYGGTGLGLSIIKHLTELMDGTIKVESILNEGTEFIVALPLKAITQQQVITVSKQPDLERLNLAINKIRVLVAEDNKANQAIIKLMLERQGHEVYIVSNGEEAILEIKKETLPSYDLILMDVSMPIKDGITATKELRELGIRLPIIAITAHAMNAEKKMCLDAGMDDFISKPIRAIELKKLLVSLDL